MVACMIESWIAIEIGLPDHPKVRRMARSLAIEADTVVGKLVRVWGWFDSVSTNGHVDALVDADIDDLARQNGFASAMRDVGWLNGVDTGNVYKGIPKFGSHHGNSAKKRALKSKRQARWRENKKARDAEDTVDAGVDARETSTESTGRRLQASPTETETDTSKESPSRAHAPAREGDDLKVATAAGKAAKAMIQAGAPRANPSNPDLLAALAEGITAETLADTVREALRLKKYEPFTWAVATARSRHAEGPSPRPTGGTRNVTRKLTPSEQVRQAIAAQKPAEHDLGEDD
jgi:hypothetical protein